MKHAWKGNGGLGGLLGLEIVLHQISMFVGGGGVGKLGGGRAEGRGALLLSSITAFVIVMRSHCERFVPVFSMV